ncbi:MAG: hypothetical protein M1393_08475 [Candidatus Thermoplasmatota archaeon]|nr:hypothetical protein [Candidatus Thermoplasmatota archaeon]MCL6091055.1 hypothetical protein [Candidatus Thermoplasmatota archaeon]MDA8143691.1 hypothetical protein [Thermoplasmatales archaeon]
MHIIQVEYENEAERKKIEYIMNQWPQSTERPKGYVIFVKDEDFEVLYQTIAAKFPESRIGSYKLAEVRPEIESLTCRVSFVFSDMQKYDQVKAFINYLVNKRRGVLVSSLGDILSYRIMTRKATVELDVTFISTQPVKLLIEIRGPTEGVNLVEKEFSQEIEIFGGIKNGK